MKKKTGIKLEVIKKGIDITQLRSTEDLKQVAAGKPPQLGCGGPGQCIA